VKSFAKSLRIDAEAARNRCLISVIVAALVHSRNQSTERAVLLKRDLTSGDDRSVRRRLIPSDQKRKLTQEASMILEAGHDFGWRYMIASIRSCRASVKPGRRSSTAGAAELFFPESISAAVHIHSPCRHSRRQILRRHYPTTSATVRPPNPHSSPR